MRYAIRRTQRPSATACAGDALSDAIWREMQSGGRCTPAGSSEWRGKCGKARWTNPLGMRLPPTDCWPTHAIICEMLMKDPLEPHRAIVSGAFRWCSSLLQISPASSRILERSPFISDSRVCSIVQPGDGARLPELKASVLS